MGLFLGNKKIAPVIPVNVCIKINNQDKTVTSNGTYSADEGYTGLGNVIVNVPYNGFPIELTQWGQYGFLSGNFNFKILDNATSISKSGLQGAFYSRPNLLSVDFSNVRSIGESGLQETFYKCVNLKTAKLTNVETIQSNGLYHAFQDCINLTSVDFSNLKGLEYSALQGAFAGCTKLKTLSFPNLHDWFTIDPSGCMRDLVKDVTGCTIHFPCDIEDFFKPYQKYLGGTNTVVLYDLPAME